MRVTHHPVDPDQVLSRLGPGRQVHVAHHPPVLPHAQMEAAAVDEHLGEVVELGDELLRFKGEGGGGGGVRLALVLSSEAAAFFHHIIGRRHLGVRDATLEDGVVKNNGGGGKKAAPASR